LLVRAGDLELVWETACSAPSGPSIEGSFSTLMPFAFRPTPLQTARIFAQLIRPLVGASIGEADPRGRKDDLVLQVRAGDASSSPEDASNHGQPPLSFYLYLSICVGRGARGAVADLARP